MDGNWWLTPAEWEAMSLSLRVGLLCVAVSVVPGVIVGWVLARCRFRGKTLVDAAVQLPMVMPPVLVGYLLVMLLGRGGYLGGWLESWFGVRVAFTMWAAVIASAVVSFPLMVRSVRLAIEAVDPKLEDASRMCGASRWNAILTTTLPMAWPGVLMGMLLCFVRSLGEFGATIMFAGNIEGQTRTLPLALYQAMQTPGESLVVQRLAVAAIVLSILAVVASEYLNRRALEAREAAA